ncbi:electron transfer flavoprotein subunit beta/FixA family protein [Schaalia sp. Marseille-Q2122]|uniref:electron transfer flavoprotein subunit beta/FixA family protein n=1 Tax=Schaalia sp. Marseille-Q2122 TaxID=2736604 RepID=UPI00158E482F|nr:electron transfer flavoprotein subunit beta/FixA family protein [Schaalia sp. Marseille-Q2122]
MRIVVCVKHVPDVQSERRFEDGRLVRGEDDVLNELDENAVEAAVSLVEEHGGEVIALTMGPADAEDALMRTLQMGADRALLISDDALEGTDAVGTAAVLAAGVARIEDEHGPVDMVVTGMASLDAMTSLVPAALAAHLGRPLLSLAHALDISGEGPWTATITRSVDGMDEVLSASTPLVLSVTDQINEPRYPSFKTMKAARSKPLDELSLDDLGCEAPRCATIVNQTVEHQRDGSGTIVTDSGDAGERLALYLINEVK